MQYTLRRNPRAKRVSITLDSQGSVIVSAPPRVSSKIVESFLKKQQSWIDNQRDKIKKKRQLIESKSHLLLFGKIYKKNISVVDSTVRGIYIQDDQICFNYPLQNIIKSQHCSKRAEDCSDQEITKIRRTLFEKELKIFLKKNARTYLTQQAKNFAKKMDVSYNKLTLRQQKTRWGSCSSKNNLSLNWRLVHYAPPILDYVIIHELAHLIHHNHSKQFWKLVAKYDPYYQKHRKYLKENGVVC